MTPALFPWLLLLYAGWYRPFRRCMVLLPGMLAVFGGVSAQQAPEIEVQGGLPRQTIIAGDLQPCLADGTSLPPVRAGEQVVRTFMVSNLGDSPLNLTAITLTGRFSGYFRIQSVTAKNAPQALPLTLASGEHALFTLAYCAAEAGKHPASITLHNNDEDEGMFSFLTEGKSIPVTLPPGDPLPPLTDLMSATGPDLP